MGPYRWYTCCALLSLLLCGTLHAALGTALCGGPCVHGTAQAWILRAVTLGAAVLVALWLHRSPLAPEVALTPFLADGASRLDLGIG